MGRMPLNFPARTVACLALVALGSAALGAMATAAPPSHGWWFCPGISLYRPCLICPNDYCPKPTPCPPCSVCCFGPNDYCCKPLPCTPPYCGFGCDDYCCKPPPEISPCYTPPGSTCGSPDRPYCPGSNTNSCSLSSPNPTSAKP
ncbi:MAG TPA: hypothetical protein VFE46_08745 [Pirellulales bacterium]|nr:hypothetical protein [Pirellulales bacterium]